jgi:hypothetical protein
MTDADSPPSASGGIRATVAFSTDPVCPVARHTATTGAVVESVSTSVARGEAAPVTEFVSDADTVPEDASLEPVISYGDVGYYRRRHDGDEGCPCECLGDFGCPVDRYAARDGELTLVFHAADFADLQTVVGALRERYPDVDIRRLVRSPAADSPADTVFVDRSKLTPRQLEVVRTAYELGYFERPRETNATALAAELDIDPSTLAEHLASAQRKLLGDVLEDG